MSEPTFRIIDPAGTVRVWTSGAGLPLVASSVPAQQFVAAIAELRAAAGLAVFDVRPVEPPADPPEFRYRFEAHDGRTWEQNIRVPPAGADVSMNFDVPSHWTLGEFAPHRSVRDVVVNMIRNYGVDRIRVEWAAV